MTDLAEKLLTQHFTAMSVPGLTRWLQENYPECCTRCACKDEYVDLAVRLSLDDPLELSEEAEAKIKCDAKKAKVKEEKKKEREMLCPQKKRKEDAINAAVQTYAKEWKQVHRVQKQEGTFTADCWQFAQMYLATKEELIRFIRTHASNIPWWFLERKKHDELIVIAMSVVVRHISSNNWKCPEMMN
jgi:hypothetical protein